MSKSGNDTRVQHTIEERRDGKNETDERTGGADVEERAVGANGRTHENEGAERANEGREGNEERIAGMYAMAATGEKMSKFVRQKNREQSDGEGQASEKASRILIEELEGGEEIFDGSALVFGVGGGELRASDETGAER